MTVPQCQACLLPYDAGELSPIILSGCGHGVCLACLNRLTGASPCLCPVCGQRTDPATSQPAPWGPSSPTASGASIGVAAPQQASPPTKVEACPTHGDRIRFLCATHNVLCCATCFLEDHDDCDRHPLEAARQQLERRIISALNDMRESGERLQAAQISLAERSGALYTMRQTVKTEVKKFFEEYTLEIEKRKETLLTQADVYFDSVDLTLKSRLTYLTNGLMFLEGLFQEMSSLRKASQVEFLLQGPLIALKMENAVVEAKQAIGPIEELGRPDAPTPYFLPPSPASIAASLATIKVQDGVAPASPSSAASPRVPSPFSPVQQQPQQQPPQQQDAVAVAPPAKPAEKRSVARPSPTPAETTTTQQPAKQHNNNNHNNNKAGPTANGPANGAAVAPSAPPPPPTPKAGAAKPSPPAKVVENGNGHHAAPPVVEAAWGGKGVAKVGGSGKPDIHDEADFPPLEAKQGGMNEWLVAGAEKKEKERKEKKEKEKQAAQAKAQQEKEQQNGGGGNKGDKEGGGGKEKGKGKKAAAAAANGVAAATSGAPFSADKPQLCVMNNTTNGGMDGFLHLHSTDGLYFAIYYNFIGKVATINRDGSDPKTYKKGDKFFVELKDNPYVSLAEEKPERKYVAAGLRRV